MHWSTITMLFAATVLGVPAPVLVKRELSILPEQIQQGDGFYLAVFDEAGVASVAFTPKAELLTRRASVSTSENVAARTVSTLSKRETVYHGRTSNVGDLDWANGELANHANNKWFDARTWAWVSQQYPSSLMAVN
jgi:hypothetical protein